MRLKKAIEVLSRDDYPEVIILDPDFPDALKLATEAMKAWQEQRQDVTYHHIRLLPGETEE